MPESNRGSSPPALLTHSQELIGKAASSRRHVLIVAEPGLDIEEVAREIHAGGPTASGPFVTVDCPATDPIQVEQDVLGGKPARRTRRSSAPLEVVSPDSRLATARGGTLFLMGVNELPASVQVRLAWLLRDGEVRVDGSRRPAKVDVRLIASTVTTLEADVDEGRFRSDLYRQLSRIRIELIPLRQRAKDIPAMVQHLMQDICDAAGVPVKTFTEAALALLSSLPWRGNTRELRAVLERVALAEPEAVAQVEDVLEHVRLDTRSMPIRPNGNLREAKTQFEREYIVAVLRRHGWRMREAADELGIGRTNLYRKARLLGIQRVKAGRAITQARRI